MQEMSFTAQIERRKKEFENEARILSSHCFLRASRGDFDGWEIKTEDFVLFDASTQRLVAAFFTGEEEFLHRRDSAIKFFEAMHKHRHHLVRHSVAQGGKCYGEPFLYYYVLTSPRSWVSRRLPIRDVIWPIR